MKFFHPQIQLARETVLNESEYEPDVFYLHIVTFCPRTCFRADGYETPGFGPNNETQAEGLYKVVIKLIQDTTLPDYGYITPVVHTIALGSIDFPGGEGEIEVQVQGAVVENDGGGMRGDTNPPTTTTKTGGTGTVGTTGADSISRPIEEDSL
ncbi:MAG: hypothetical protein KDC61_21120 [Saprospiraceae bacterium]|nr:hypothetical protein [Saprospiraceae bacterium]